MKLLSLIFVVLGLGIARADGPPAKPADKPDAATQAKLDKFLKFWDTFVDAVVAAKTDCEKGAADITTLADANKDVLAGAAEAKAAGKKLPQPIVDHMQAGIQKMMPTLRACMSNPKFKTAIERVKPSNDAKGGDTKKN